MSLSGTFSTMPLPDLLQWIGDSRKTGLLTLSLEMEERFLRVEAGEVVAVETEDPRARELGQACVEAGLLDEAGFVAALEGAERSGRSVAEVLRTDGRLGAEAIDAALAAWVSRAVLGMFLWREGRFHFTDGESSLLGAALRQELCLRTPVGLRGLIMEGMRRLDEWQRIAQVFPSDLCQVHALGRDETLPILDELSARGEPAVLGELWAFGGDRYRIYEQLFQAWSRGLLAVDTPTPAPGPTESPLDTLVRSGALLLDERQFDEAATLLRTVLNVDPGRGDVRELLRRTREEQLAELYQLIPPFKVPVLCVGRDALARMKLSPRERHIAGRVNGRWDVGALVVVTPVGELETMRALKKLIHVGAVGFAA